MPGYTLPDGVTLKNKFGLNDPDELERVEAAFVSARYDEIDAGFGPSGQFDAEHLKAIHQYLFQDVYEWAGHTRDERITLSDGTLATEPILSKPDGQPFLVGPAISAALDAFGTKLQETDNLRGLPREEFAERAADVLIELNDIHPFREGNGRAQRVFMEQLAHEAGHELDFEVVSKERMIQASIAAHEQDDPSMIRRMFDEISNPDRCALLRESISQLEKLEFDWNDHYVATLAHGHPTDLVFVGVAGDQFMARTKSEIFFGKTSDLPEPCPERGATFAVTASSYTPREAIDARSSEVAGAEPDVIVEKSDEPTASVESSHGHEGKALISGVERLAEGVADMAGHAIEAVADGLASLLGGGSSGPRVERSSETPDNRDLPRDQDLASQTDNNREALRMQYLRNLDREVPQEVEHDAEGEHHSRERER